jgi:glutamate 5-kinase
MSGEPVIKALAASRRMVVKIGSKLLADEETGRLRRRWLTALVADVVHLRGCGPEILLVTSGAIAVGRRPLGLVRRNLRLEEKQAAAAAGQIRLAHAYEEAFARHHISVAQVLLTLDDTESRRRYLNARNTIAALLRLGSVPVVNENDTVGTAEIRFGENDRLAARVAQMIGADTLVLLSDVDGLYTGDPRRDPNASHIPVIREVTKEIEAMAGEAPPGYSSGGMVTKLAAAKIALAAGCRVAVADGKPERPLAALAAGARATWFLPRATPRSARKHWIAGSLRPAGALVVDNGAQEALARGKSLLPAGVVAVEGEFQKGEAVIVRSADGAEIARGLVAYPAAEARRILGHKSDEIEGILGYRGRQELIHRDDLVVE